MTHVDLIYFNAGGGHRAAAEALREVMQGDPSPWRVRLLNLFELLDPQQRFRRLTGMPPEELYNRRLARGWTLGMAQELKLLQAGIRLAHPQLAQRLQRHWERGAPDIAVSLVPNFNRSIAHGLRATGRDLPFVTVLTDLADLPPRFWIEPGTGQHVVCGTDRALEQARAQGVPETRLHRVSGMILRPGFYRSPAQPRADARRGLGLDEHTPTGVVMFGGHGSSAMLRIAESLPKVPLILMCGHNRRLAEQLRALPAAAPRVVVGYTTEVADHLRLGDFFVGKPGPGSLSEALHCGLPVIVTRNAWTMPQERYNTDWVAEQGVGLVLHSFAALPAAVTRLQTHLPRFLAQVRRMDNRALFELPPLLAAIAGAARQDAAPGAAAVGHVGRPAVAANDAAGATVVSR
jgi:hypothetical protein